MPFVLTPQREALLAAPGNLLVLGGPGAGKTSVALLKAAHDARGGLLKPAQKILFLSFARSTIARVAELAAEPALAGDVRTHLEINTYHGFLWNLLRSHGYLLHAANPIRLLPPPQAAARMAHLAKADRPAEAERLFARDGLLHFDLFASVGVDLLSRSRALRRVICDAYPLIILDEFQDTNAAEWAFIQTLGHGGSRLIALADPDQRIYEFRGADPRRIEEYTRAFAPQIFDFGADNYRSDGRDLTTFGNDVLTGRNIGREYNDVDVSQYGFYRGRHDLFPLKCAVLQRLRSLIAEAPHDWSLALLVPAKKLMLQVSDYLDADTDGLPSLSHDVALDSEAPALAAALIAGLLEAAPAANAVAQKLLSDLCQHIRGRRGADQPPQGALQLVDAVGEFLQTGNVRGAKRKRIIDGAKRLSEARLAAALTGQPDQDWLLVRRLLADSGIPEYVQVAEDARFLRLLHKGATLRARLGELWRRHSGYPGATAAVNSALLQEHFSASQRDWRGIHLMTMHKSKGKQFSEVLIYEGRHHGKITWADADARKQAQQKLTLRVAVTRATTRATILTPASSPCPFL